MVSTVLTCDEVRTDNAKYAQPVRGLRFEECYWYTTMEVPGHGVVKGGWDLREYFDAYTGNVPLAGKKVLDVGAASGFLTFEAEKRGASVTAFDADSMRQVFRLPFAENQYFQDFDAWARDAEPGLEMLKNGFWFLHERRNSSAKVIYGDIFHLHRHLPEQADIAIVGAILEHLNDPLSALGSIARVTKECIIIAFTPLIETEELLAKPILPMTDPKDTMTWWNYSLGLYRRILENVGFAIESVTPAYAYHERERALVERRTIVAKKRT